MSEQYWHLNVRVREGQSLSDQLRELKVAGFTVVSGMREGAAMEELEVGSEPERDERDRRWVANQRRLIEGGAPRSGAASRSAPRGTLAALIAKSGKRDVVMNPIALAECGEL